MRTFFVPPDSMPRAPRYLVRASRADDEQHGQLFLTCPGASAQAMGPAVPGLRERTGEPYRGPLAMMEEILTIGHLR